MANRKKFNMEMGAYLRSRRREEEDRGEIQEFRARKQRSQEQVPDMRPGEVHVEYERPGFFRRLFSGKRREVIERSEDLTPEEKQKLMEMEAKVEGIEDQMDEIEDMEEDLEVQRESLISRILKGIGFKREPGEDIDEYDEAEYLRKDASGAVDDDVKEVLKIAHVWLEQLSPKKKAAFKESDDFNRYKNILVRYGLIRVRAEVKEEPKKEKAKTKEEKPEEKEAPKKKKQKK